MNKKIFENKIFVILFLIILIGGCIDFSDNNEKNGDEKIKPDYGKIPDKNKIYEVDAYSLHNISRVKLNGIALINETKNINLSDKIILKDRVVDIHIVNETEAEKHGQENNTTALCFLAKYKYLYFNDTSGPYVGNGFAIFLKLINKTIEINDTVKITFIVESRKIIKTPKLIIDFNVKEENITGIK